MHVKCLNNTETSSNSAQHNSSPIEDLASNIGLSIDVIEE